jgi:Na+-transporting methylmalonyl-CoA/oxaloacetate decarboxylase gamma subunit
LKHLILGVTNPFPDQETKLRPGLDPDQVTPGALGFFATFFMVLAIILLMRSMTKRIRRVRYREAVAEQGPAAKQHGSALLEPAQPDARIVPVLSVALPEADGPRR